MNTFLKAFINSFKSFDRGDLANYPDPAPPSDLGAAMTQDDIDFVKSLRKEMIERFDPPAPSCTDEKTGVAISDTTSTSFTLAWTNPVGYLSTQVLYRATGGFTWLTPNAMGNASGHYNGTYDAFIFTAGFSASISYDIIVRNQCPNGIISTGVIRTSTAT